MSVRKVGMEEELLLVDPDSRRVVSVAGAAVEANERDEEVGAELFQHQIETSTPPVTDADELERHLRAGRRAVGEAAAAAGARAVAVSTPPLPPEAAMFVKTPRYDRFAPRYGELARDAHVCGMHLHVDVADDAEAVRVVDGLQPWLPFLLAVSGNSPYWEERDTGHASWRSRVWGQWSTAGPSQPFGDVARYREVTGQMVDWGGALDGGMLYLDARLSEQYPTVEIRVADVCTDPEDGILVALLARSLVESAATLEPPAGPWRADLLRVAAWRASRHGLTGDLVHPVEGRLASPREVFAAVLSYAGGALREAGDEERVVDGFERLMSRGTGATRQRRLVEAGADLGGVVDDLARRTEESWG
jgi:carboxylate-amine ligase